MLHQSWWRDNEINQKKLLPLHESAHTSELLTTAGYSSPLYSYAHRWKDSDIIQFWGSERWKVLVGLPHICEKQELLILYWCLFCMNCDPPPSAFFAPLLPLPGRLLVFILRNPPYNRHHIALECNLLSMLRKKRSVIWGWWVPFMFVW